MCRYPAVAVGGFAQGLRDHRLQRFREHGADHFFFLGREHVDDPVYGFGRAGGVQGSKDQMPGFGRCDGQANGLQVAHLAHQNRVGVFAQGRAQGGRKTVGVHAHLALVDETTFRVVNEFNRILHRQDVALHVVVEVIHHGGQGGGFAGSGGPGNQDQPVMLEGQIGKNGGRVQFLECQDFARDRAQNRPGPALLVESIHPKARQALNFKSKIDLQMLLEVFALRVGHDVGHQGQHRRVVERFHVDAAGVAVHA